MCHDINGWARQKPSLNLAILDTARHVLSEQWPVVAGHSPDPQLQMTAKALAEALAGENALEQLEKVRQAAEPLANEYAVLYRRTFEQRDKAYETAIEQVKGLPEWDAICKDADVTDLEREGLLLPLKSRFSGKLDLPPGATVCRNTRATISQMESDIAAVEPLARDVIRRLQQFIQPEENIERFRVSQHITGKITNEQELDAAMKTLRDKLSKLLAQGCKVILE
jgi:hypothetical protein